ncbi:MAG: 50S ribosomal protein L11 methyltransferase [Anaerolineales bacterium]|nr:50S ribosomal protein L11 methyltransferase [Anaerolineales bacterium]MDW8446630.1 50S ribosomal protein L11 methyltransferase [Anaerolineales bacterium]
MDSDSWLEVSLTVNGELAEAVAEVLSRFAPNGVAMEMQVRDFDAEGRGIPGGDIRVSAYLPVNAELEEKRTQLEQALWYLGRIQPLPEPRYRLLQEADWSEAWKKHYHPILIGKRLVIVPAWLENPEPHRVAVTLDPGMAFGTGTHPTTQLCLAWLEDLLSAESEGSSRYRDLIDVGCGSGILAIAAIKLGLQRALAVDLDPIAVQAALENARSNGVSDRIEVGHGSVAEIRSGTFALKQADLVVANILAPTLLELLQQGLAELLRPDGALILSGILCDQQAEIEAAMKENGLSRIEVRQQEDWVALLGRR